MVLWQGEERLKQSGLEKYFGARLGSRQATKPCLGSLEPHWANYNTGGVETQAMQGPWYKAKLDKLIKKKSTMINKK
jgi:hypothetical protein